MHPHLVHPHRTTRSRRWFLLAVVTVSALAVAVGAAPGSPTKSQQSTLTALIGSSGPAETFAVTGAVKAFTKQTGIEVNLVVASDLGQQLAQGFASGNPPDIFYLSNDSVATYAQAGSLAPLNKLKNVKAFYPSLRAAYTYKGNLYAAPKDFSTLALVINSASWQRAKLTVKDTRRRGVAASVAKSSPDAGRPLHGSEVPASRRVHDSEPGWLVSRTTRQQQQGEHQAFFRQEITGSSLTNQLGVGWAVKAGSRCAMTIEGN
jgi:multiple sugar transport system substrate-binding protein